MISGSPGQLSPGSSIAPTIPTAPHSPCQLDSFDFDSPFDSFGFPSPSNASTANAYFNQPQLNHPSSHGYGTTNNKPRSHSARYGSLDHSLDRSTSGGRSQPQPTTKRPDLSRSVPNTPYDDMTRSLGSTSGLMATGTGNDIGKSSAAQRLHDQLDYVAKSSTLDRANFARNPYDFERPKTTPPTLNGGGSMHNMDSLDRRQQSGRFSPYAGLTKEDFYPTNLRNSGSIDRRSSSSGTAPRMQQQKQQTKTEEPKYPM